jgi:DHA1 family multidrug resistance protein-like MFS transporter
VRTVVVLTIAQVVSEVGFSFALPFTPLLIQQLGVDDLAEVGLWAGIIAGVFAVAMGGMAPIWGIVADRFGHRLMIQRAFFGAGAATTLIYFVQTPEQLLVLRVMHGIFTGVVTAIATMVSLTAPRQHMATVLGLLQAAVYFGITLGPLAGGAFADRFGLRAAFAGSGIILILTGLMVTFCVPSPTRDAARPHGATGGGSAGARPRERFLRRELLVVVTLMALARFSQMGPQPFIPLFVQQLVPSQEGLATTVGFVLAANGVASTVSALLIGRVDRWFGRRATLVCCLLVAAVLSGLQAGVSAVWQLVALRVVLGLAQGGTGPAIQALLIDVTPPGRRGAAFGLLTTANAAGNGGGPLFGSLIAASFGVPAVFLATTPPYLLAAWIVARIRPRPPSAAQS